MAHKALFVTVIIIMMGISACDDATCQEAVGLYLQLEEPGENCDYGGVVATTPDSDPLYVCESAEGATAAVTELAAGDLCPLGGMEVHYLGSVLTLCHEDNGPVTVTPVPAGPSCPDGGLAITDAEGTSYVCSEASMSLTLEAPGANCTNGGVAITDASGSTYYVCHGDSPAEGIPGSLCPEETHAMATPGESIYALIEGSTQGVYPGGATAPDGSLNAIKVEATCHSMTSPTDPGTGTPTGKAYFAPYFLIFKTDPTLIHFYNSLVTKEVLQAEVLAYEAATTLSTSLSLGNSRIMSVEQLTLPDRDIPGTFSEYLRVGIAYSSFSFTHEASGENYFVDEIGMSAGPGFDATYAPETSNCVVSPGVYPHKFMTLTGVSQGTIGGDAMHELEAGSIELYSVCHSLYNLGFPTSTGAKSVKSLVITKSMDSASPRLIQGLFATERFSGSINFYRLTDLGSEEFYYSLDLANARIIDIEQYSQSGSHFERIELVFDSLTHNWRTPELSTTVTWAPVTE